MKISLYMKFGYINTLLLFVRRLLFDTFSFLTWLLPWFNNLSTFPVAHRTSSYSLVYTVEADGKMLDGRVNAIPDVTEMNSQIESMSITSASGETYVSTSVKTVSSTTTSSSSSSAETTELSVVTKSQTDAVVVSGYVATADFEAFATSIQSAIDEGESSFMITALKYIMACVLRLGIT